MAVLDEILVTVVKANFNFLCKGTYSPQSAIPIRSYWYSMSTSENVYFFVSENSLSHFSPKSEKILQKGIEISDNICYT